MTIDAASLAERKARAGRGFDAAGTHLVLLVSGDGLVDYAGPSVRRILGYTPDELLDMAIEELVHPDDLDAAQQLLTDSRIVPIDRPAGHGRALGAEWRLRHHAGHWVSLAIVATNELAQPDVQGIVIIGQPSRARLDAEEALGALAHSSVDRHGYDLLLDAIEEEASGVAAALCLAGRWPQWIQHGVPAELCPPAGVGPWTSAFERGENVVVEDFDGAIAAEMMSEELAYVARRAGYLACWCVVIPTTRSDLPSEGRAPLGCFVLWSSEQLRPPSGLERMLAGLAVIADLGLGRREAELGLRWAARHDDLTGVFNRRGLVAEIEEGRRPGAVLLLDFDGFREVNDEHGHTAGDEVMAALAERLRTAVRGDDLVGRLGGDAFAVFLPDATPQSSAAAADRLVEVFLQPLVVGELELTLSASIGIDCSQNATLDEQIDRADRSLLVAKRAGRGRIAIWAEDEE